MKTFVSLIIAMLFVSHAFGEDIVADSKTIAWDAVTTLSNDTNIPTADKIEYEVFTKNSLGFQESVGITPTASYLVTLKTEGAFVIGVRALRTPQGQVNAIPSEISWSDAPTRVAGNTWRLLYYLAPKYPIFK